MKGNTPSEIRNPKIELASNGLIVSYDCYSKYDDKDMYSSRYDKNEKEVFPLKDSAKAMERLIELGKKAGLVSGEEEEED